LRARGWTPAVLTFDPHPARVLAPERAPKLISTIAQRLRRMESEGVKAAMLLAFSRELARLSPEEFARTVLAEKLHARVVIIGEDFRFGYKQSGDLRTMRSLGEKLGFEVESAGTIQRRGARISSTAVRQLVESGQMSKACRMLGEPFALEGSVVQGHGIGSKQTVPTLNLAPENELLPPVGVYATETWDEKSGRRWKSITNVGYRPTFEGQGLTVETFLLDPFEGETPDRIEVSFLRFVRDERKFDTPELLRAQIMRDVAVAKRVHGRRARLLHLHTKS